MGNSSSHSIQLGNSRSSTLYESGHRKENRLKRLNKYASPGNMVLPPPVMGQKLRHTDNGSILQNGGTISGRKVQSLAQQDSSEINPDFLKILQRRSMIEESERTGDSMYGHKKSHSDPDISRSVMDSHEDEEDYDDEDDGPVSRSIIAVSPSKAKIKSRKKAKAPEPPQQSSTLPRELDKMPVTHSQKDDSGTKKNVFSKLRGSRSDSKSKSPAPPPPASLSSNVPLPPPPPPPPPDYNRDSDEQESSKGNTSYEKNRRPVEKWKQCKSEQMRDDLPSRNLVFDSKQVTKTSKPPLTSSTSSGSNNSKMDRRMSNDLKQELMEVTNRRASNSDFSHHQDSSYQRQNSNQDSRLKETRPSQKSSNSRTSEQPQQYYFSNFDALKAAEKSQVKSNDTAPVVTKAIISHTFATSDQVHEVRKVVEYTSNNGPNRSSSRKMEHKPLTTSNSKDSKETNNFERHKESRSPVRAWNKKDTSPAYPRPKNRWSSDDLSGRGSSSPKSTLSSSSDQELNLNIHLRPTLPRKPLEMPRFSPTEAWRALSSEHQHASRHRSEPSTDEGDIFEEQIHRVSCQMAPPRSFADRCGDSGISPDAGSPLLAHESIDNFLSDRNSYMPGTGRRSAGVGRASPPEDVPDNNWIPKEDLMDDSDTASIDPLRNQEQPKITVQAKFTLPNNMFSWSNNKCESKDRSKHRGRRKKSSRGVESTSSQNFNSLRNLGRALGFKSKEIDTEEKKGIDSNWSLSRSAPNSLNILSDVELVNSCADKPPRLSEKFSDDFKSPPSTLPNDLGSPEKILLSDPEEKAEIVPTRRTSSFSFYSREGHVMYLPEYNTVQLHSQSDRETTSRNNSTHSTPMKTTQKDKKKFSYMSTVRKEERKKLEEQLTRQVAEKEKLREREIQWMNKVEDEFRKQRDREKINIRQQLRVLNMESKGRSHSSDVNFPDLQMNSLPNIPTGYYADQQPDDKDRNGNDMWNKLTGMSKWLRRRSDDANTHHLRNFSPPRPEPEGGRSSGDECRTSLENLRSHKETPLNDLPDKSRPPHQSNASEEECRKHRPLSRNGHRSLSPISQLETASRSSRNRSSSPIAQKRSSSCEDPHYYEIGNFSSKPSRNNLIRSGSGRTYESHSNYLYSVPNKNKKNAMAEAVPNRKPVLGRRVENGLKQNGRHRSLDDSDSYSDEVFSPTGRVVGRRKECIGAKDCNGYSSEDECNDKPVKANGSLALPSSPRSVLPVQPFSPSKGYRPVPFNATQQPRQVASFVDTSKKHSEVPVEAR